MAGSDGRLTDADREKIQKHIDDKMVLIGKCSICSSRSWTLIDHLVHLPIFYGAGIIMAGGPAVPNVGFVCQNCGNTQLLNAVHIGVTLPDARTPSDLEGDQ